MTWTRVILLAWALLIAWSERWQFHPTSYWFRVHQITVHDAHVGQCPRLDVDRTIYRPFEATWLVTIDRWSGGGWVTLPPSFPGQNDYSPDAELPNPLTLDWWANDPAACALSPGRYRLRTAYFLTLPDGRLRHLRISSSEFTVEAMP